MDRGTWCWPAEGRPVCRWRAHPSWVALALALGCLPWCQQIPGFSLHTFLLRLAKPREAFLIIFFIGETYVMNLSKFILRFQFSFSCSFFFFSVKH